MEKGRVRVKKTEKGFAGRRGGCESRRMIFHPLKRIGCVVLLLLGGLSGSTISQAAIDTNGIPFVAHLSGANGVPINEIGMEICGRFWLVGSNLNYRLAIRVRPDRIFEFRGPAEPGTTGSFLQDVVHEMKVFGSNLCDVASGAYYGRFPQMPGVREFALSEGVLALEPDQILQLLAGLIYVRAVYDHDSPRLPSPGEIRDQITLLDTDSDGIPDYVDQCPGTLAGSLVNSNGCSIADLCPCEGPWKNHGQFEHCVKEAAKDFEKAGLITKPQRHEIEKAAKESDCGKKEKPAKPPKGD